MRVLTGERDKCPDCGGKVQVTSTGIACLSCDFYKEITNQTTLASIRQASEELIVDVELTYIGETLLKSNLHELLEYRRIAQNLKEGYELKDKDKHSLLEAGFARNVATPVALEKI